MKCKFCKEASEMYSFTRDACGVLYLEVFQCPNCSSSYEKWTDENYNIIEHKCKWKEGEANQIVFNIVYTTRQDQDIEIKQNSRLCDCPVFANISVNKGILQVDGSTSIKGDIYVKKGGTLKLKNGYVEGSVYNQGGFVEVYPGVRITGNVLETDNATTFKHAGADVIIWSKNLKK